MLASIRNNTSYVSIMSSLSRSNQLMEKSAQRLSSGSRLNSAADDPSGYAISKKMGIQIRILEKQLQNTRLEQASRKMSMGYMDSINSALASMTELALKSANGIYSAQDRRLMEEKFTGTIASVDDAAKDNGLNSLDLLGGLYEDTETTSVNAAVEPTNDHGVIAADAGNITITDGGKYTIADGYTGTITIAAQNVSLESASGTSLKNVNIKSEGENTNLWLKGVSIDNTDNQESVVSFTGKGNTLHVSGTSSFSSTADNGNAVIAMGESLSIYNEGTLNVKKSGGSGAGIGTNSGDPADALVIKGGILNVTTSGLGAGIGTGRNGSLNRLSLLHTVLSVTASGEGAAIGAGAANSFVGKLTIDDCQGTAEGVSSAFGQNSTGRGRIGLISADGNTLTYNSKSLTSLQLSGATAQDDTQKKQSYISPISAKALGLDMLHVDTAENAQIAYKKLQSILATSLEKTASLGAANAALDKKEDSLTAELENLRSAQSVMSDTDIPKEMIQYTTNKILNNVGLIMLKNTNKNLGLLLNLIQ